LKPGLIRRWREYLHRVARADHPVFGPWHELVVADSRASAPVIRTEQLNPLVRAALASAAPKSPEDVAKMYGRLFSDVYRQSQSPGPRPAGFDELLAVLMADDSPTNVPLSEFPRYLQRAERDRLEKIENQFNTLLVHSPAAPPRAMTLVERPHPHDPVVLTRGNPSQPGEPVPRQFLRLLAGEGRRPFRDGSGRLELASAIASRENPLTARVIANRVWMHHLGSPLVSTPDDFGTRSQPPTHSELLDYLAWRLIDGGWSLKKLHREIMLSGVYRQSSADRADGRLADPENRLYWRMNRQRLDLEPLRDSMLAVAGRLDETMHGRPVELLREPYPRRRTIYGRIDRHQLSAIYRTFDFPNPHQTAASRPQTTVPQQALFLMNAPFVIEQARALAARKEVAAASDEGGRIDGLYRFTLSRRASVDDIAAAKLFLKEASATPVGDTQLNPWEQLAQVLMLTNEFLFVD
jgi:hypothetical protein